MRQVTRSIAAVLVAAAVAGAAVFAGAPAAAAPTPNGTLALTNATPAPGDTLTFSYTTSTPNAKNWIAVYNDPSTGPTDEKNHGSSTDWAYVNATTASSSGTVSVASTGLTPGHDLVAYFLYADGYTWLAQPVTFRVGYGTTGTLKLTTAAPQAGKGLTFTYTTGKDNAAGKDWVAIYDDPNKSPLNQTYPGSGSTAWSYVSGTSGSVTIPAGALTAGHDVIAYLLYNDGYTWLADPVVFRLAAASSGPTADGTLKLLTANPTAGKPLQFSFTTSTPNATNWIGVYDDPSTIPSGGVSHGGSTTWAYVPNATSGTVTIPSGALTGGHDVAAVLLYQDGYVNLAPPITFALKAEPPLTGSAEPTTDHFLTDDIVRPAVKPSTAVQFTVAGLWAGVAGAAPGAATFAKQAGSDWLAVAADGTITGSAPAAVPAQTPLLSVTATEASGVSGTLTVELPVAEPGAPPVTHAATLSMWDGGSHVDDPVGKLVRSILVNRFDLVALQSTGGRATAVAQRLGWNVVEDATGRAVVAPYALAARAAPPATPAIAVEATIGSIPLRIWNVALDAGGADPSSVCTAGAAATIAAEKTTTRYSQARAVADAAHSATGSTAAAPLLLLGGLNSPSSLDWTGAPGAANCGAGPVAWPVTAVLKDAGLTDAFRAARPDTSADPGATVGILGGLSAAAARPALLDRRDYIDVGGPVTVQDANLVVDGFPVASPSAANRWVSDRAAVEATILLAAAPAGDGTGAGSSGGGPGGSGTLPDPGAAPTAATAGALARTGDAIGLVAAGLAVAAVVLGSLTILVRRRRRDDAGHPAAHPQEELNP